MRIVVGVDGDEGYIGTLALIKALGFDSTSLHLVHVVEPIVPGLESAYPPGTTHGFAQLLAALEEHSEQLVREASEKAQEMGFECSTECAFGGAPRELNRIADEQDAQIVAVASDRKGRIARTFLGSVTQSLTNDSTHSLLIAKGELARTERLKAVFATDHSKYSRRCEDLLFELAPKGIEHLTVVTADDIDERALLEAFGEDEGRSSEVREELQLDLRERTQQVADRYRELDMQTQAKFVNGQAGEAIESVAAEVGADLVIMGAKGHGFVERLTLGSVSTYEVLHGVRSLLILRV